MTVLITQLSRGDDSDGVSRFIRRSTHIFLVSSSRYHHRVIKVWGKIRWREGLRGDEFGYTIYQSEEEESRAMIICTIAVGVLRRSESLHMQTPADEAKNLLSRRKKDRNYCMGRIW